MLKGPVRLSFHFSFFAGRRPHTLLLLQKEVKRAFVVKWMGHMSGKTRERIFKRQRSKSRCEFYDCVGGGGGLSGALHLSVHYIWSSINKSERRELCSATVATRSAALHSTAEPQLKL